MTCEQFLAEARKRKMIDRRLERLDAWMVDTLLFMIYFLIYVFVAVICIMLVGMTLFLQWLVNSYMHPAEPVGFLICLICVLFGIAVLGVWAWERG